MSAMKLAVFLSFAAIFLHLTSGRSNLFAALDKDNATVITGSGSGKLKGEGNYFALVIYYIEGPVTLYVANSWLGYGKWVPGKYDLSTEISSPDGLAMTAWGEYHITSTGRSWSPTGTEGSFDIYASDGQRVLYLYWDVVYAGTGEVRKEVFDNRFQVSAVRIGESQLDYTLYIKYIAGTATT